MVHGQEDAIDTTDYITKLTDLCPEFNDQQGKYCYTYCMDINIYLTSAFLLMYNQETLLNTLCA
jgi:hypothetical protein